MVSLRQGGRHISKPDGVAIVSGGFDSVTMVYQLIENGYNPRIVSFFYGQRHVKELDFALACAERLGLAYDAIDLTSVGYQITNSALTFGKEVPEGHYAEDNMAITVVPNRNLTMLSIAAAIAVNDKLDYVAAGMHAGDHAQYPDCRPEFLQAAQKTIKIANEGFISPDFHIKAPWLSLSKNDIAWRAWKLDMQPANTWSCYQGGEKHCGRCGTCVERLEAIASVTEAPPEWDQTEYIDPDYWKQAVQEYAASRNRM